MRTDWLSVSLVEELHRAIQSGSDVAGVVAGLVGGTLPGLMEYGCLRWTCPDGTVPPLLIGSLALIAAGAIRLEW
jgi:hypothetical protein